MIQLQARGVIWDLDGTLLNSLQIYEEVLSEIFRRHGIPVPSPEVFAKNSHAPLINLIKELSGFDGEMALAIRNEFIQNEEHHYEQAEKLYFPDAVHLLQRCHAAGLKQIIITSRPHHSDARLGSPRNLANRPPLQGLIQAVVCGDDNDFHKPDARVLDAVEHKLGLTRSSLVVIGDQFVDAELAYNLGSQAILVARGDAGIPNLDRLSAAQRKHITIVRSLDEIAVPVIS